MNNNDILRRIRYTLDFNDNKMMTLLSLEDDPVTREQMSEWLKKDDDDDFKACNDVHLAIFLNNLIDDKRGKKEGAQPQLEKHLTNNAILRKLKIAFNLRDEDILEIMDLAEFSISKHELSALFRKKGHKHHRVCKDQILRNFLKGLQKKYRPADYYK
ncbi:Glutamate synthase [NADPH] large chain [hydrothermal vent metagenome]|uniref:Glutamate synthase [NADPH] large chain n=1 Tax=hydrothermal vent metagenome TaxID=652676 RepID=A0A3B0WR51_9ZZZZ